MLLWCGVINVRGWGGGTAAEFVDSGRSITPANDGHFHLRSHHQPPTDQDAEVGDGTTSVVLLAAEILKQIKIFVEDGLHPQVRLGVVESNRWKGRGSFVSRWLTPNPSHDPRFIHSWMQIIIRGLRESLRLAVGKLRALSIASGEGGQEARELLEKCAGTALNSKLIAQQKASGVDACVGCVCVCV